MIFSREIFVNIFRTRVLRNILILCISIALIFPFLAEFFIYPQLRMLLIQTTEGKAIQLTRHTLETLLTRISLIIFGSAFGLIVVSVFMILIASKEALNRERARIKLLESEANLAKAQETVHEANKAVEEANKAKTEFLANISHEIRTPMNAILGMSKLALETDLSPNQRRYLTAVDTAGKALLKLLNDLLDLSKLESGKITLTEKPFHLNTLVEDTLRTLSEKAHRKGLELALKISDQFPTNIIGDSKRLRQILVNLVDNAIKFTQTGEIIVSVDQDTQDNETVFLKFSIADTGIGIEAERLEKIFESFIQVDGSISRKYGGTGLGVTIAKHLVELMGGRIWVESEVGKGSVFTFLVRVKASQDQAIFKPVLPKDLSLDKVIIIDDNKAVSAKETTQITVLLAEDDSMNQLLAETRLEQRGYRVLIANDGAEAIRYYKIHAPDVILMDMQMPDINGYEASQTIRDIEKNTGKHTPIIAMTGSTMTDDRDRALKIDIDEYITKPIDFDLLFAAMDKMTFQPGDSQNTTVEKMTEESVDTRAQPDLAEVESMFKTLDQCLQTGQAQDAEETFANLHPLVDQFIDRTLLNILANQIDNFDFDDARQTLNKMAENLNISIS